jgi:hypothetical protein
VCGELQAEVGYRHHLTFDTYEEGKLTMEEYRRIFKGCCPHYEKSKGLQTH